MAQKFVMQYVISRNAAYFNLLDVHFVIPEFHNLSYLFYNF